MVASSSDNSLICPYLHESSEDTFLEMFEDEYACVNVSLNLLRYPILHKLNLKARQMFFLSLKKSIDPDRH